MYSFPMLDYINSVLLLSVSVLASSPEAGNLNYYVNKANMKQKLLKCLDIVIVKVDSILLNSNCQNKHLYSYMKY